MRRKKKRDLKSKKGSSVLEFAFGLLTFVMLAGFVVDVIIVTNKEFTVSQTANQLVRQIAVQGGVKRTAPKGYPGGNRAYMDSREMVVMLQDTFGGAHITPRQWTMKLKGFDAAGYPIAVDVLNPASNFEVDYRNVYEFEIAYDYNWTIMGQLIPTMQSDRTAVQKRSAVSEFKYTNY